MTYERLRTTTWADVLTASRLVCAVALIPMTWALALTPAAVLLSVAWLTDVLDGRIARLAGQEGRLADWDMLIDTAVGAAVLTGLAGAGELPPWLAVVLVVGLGSLFLAGNLAAAMALQLSGYLPFLAILWVGRPQGWWLPFVTAAVIGVIDWRRLVLINIPNFIRGITGRFDGR